MSNIREYILPHLKSLLYEEECGFGFRPTSDVETSPKVLDRQTKSPVGLGISVLKLKDGTTLIQKMINSFQI
jgi:hypothetical protein